MNTIIYIKEKHELKIEYIEKITKSKPTTYSTLIEQHVCGEKNGCIYYISLEDSELIFWKITEDGSLEESVISLIEYDEDWSIEYYADKIYLDGNLIWDMNNYEPKSYLWYAHHDKDYYKAYYLSPKKDYTLPGEVSLNIDNLIREGAIFSSDSIFEKAQEIANEYYNGNFTLMKFNGQWRCGFEIPHDLSQIKKMPCGDTPEDAIINAIDYRHIYKSNQ